MKNARGVRRGMASNAKDVGKAEGETHVVCKKKWGFVNAKQEEQVTLGEVGKYIGRQLRRKFG